MPLHTKGMGPQEGRESVSRAAAHTTLLPDIHPPLPPGTDSDLMHIMSKTICQEPFERMTKCAENAKKKTEERKRELNILTEACPRSWATYTQCLDGHKRQLIEWCLSADGCERMQKEYEACVGRVASGQALGHTCDGAFETLLRCGVHSIMRRVV